MVVWTNIFREIISLSIVVCSFIDNISLKHDPETTALAWDQAPQWGEKAKNGVK